MKILTLLAVNGGYIVLPGSVYAVPMIDFETLPASMGSGTSIDDYKENIELV